MNNKPILLIDGLNCFYRHFVANPSMGENGDPIGGIIGFMKGIQLLIERYAPHEAIVVWEGGGSPRRRSIDPTYKGGRRPEKLNRFYSGDLPDTVSNRNDQILNLVSLLRKTAIPQIYISDCEADDVIARLANVGLKDKKCIIISTDKDFYQLIDERISVWSPGSKKEWTVDKVLQEFGIHPTNFCLARCFVGDGSDGLKGVPGAGFRSLAKRFTSFSNKESLTVSDILTECEDLRKQKRLKLYDSIIDNEEIVNKNWKLMYLGHGNISGTQAKKVDELLEISDSKRDKLGFIRSLRSLGIKNFDYDKLFMSLRTLG
jgi:5'-3' exonuclease|tara:strand:- start:1135 stop:2085 length:951 start_codon:yes stop_codon:yes gene_type:complete